MELPDLESALGVKSVFVKAGIAGAIAGAVVQRVVDWREAIARGVAGICCAAYLTPTCARLIGLKEIDDLGALAFAMGIGGMWVVAQIIQAAKNLPAAWERFRGIKGSSDKESGK